MAAGPPAHAAGVPRVPAGSVVYAIGDVHGRLGLLRALHAAIVADAARRPARRRVVVHLGDLVDRGEDTPGVVDHLLRWRPPGFRCVTLRGNHEHLLARWLSGDARAGRHWLRHGGLTTLEQYGAGAPPAWLLDAPWGAPGLDAALQALRERLAAALPQRHHHWLTTLAARHREGDYLFVHAGVRPGVPLARQSERDLLWIRRRFLASDAEHGAVIVHGHCPAPQPQWRRNRIGIDTGAWTSGVLTALVLEGERRAVLQTQPSAR